MTKTRILGQTPEASKSPIEWERLLKKALDRAEKLQDRRAGALRTALTQGKSSEVMRRMGIIGENDIDREFPIRVT
jgi:hypothetical protein